MGRWLKENRGLLLFVLGLGLFRTAVADWNPIPSGSMRPTLQEGDVVLVDRLAYDLKLPLTDVRLWPLGEPQRGDVVTFRSPVDGTRLIKRLVAVPGDVVALRDRRLWLNGQPAELVDGHEVIEPLADGLHLPAWQAWERGAGGAPDRQVQHLSAADGRRQDFGPVTVPADHYFMLGDHRDNSADSRAIGLVPRHRLIGRAHHLLVSVDALRHWQPRWERFGQRIE